MKVLRAVSMLAVVTFGSDAAFRFAARRVVVGGASALGAVALLMGCQKPADSGAQVAPDPGAASKAAPVLALQTAELMVEGTSCASCAVTIRRQLHQLQGIGDIREGSTKQHLLVEFDPSLVTAEQLVKAVSDAGYDAEVLVHAAGAAPVRQQGG